MVLPESMRSTVVGHVDIKVGQSGAIDVVATRPSHGEVLTMEWGECRNMTDWSDWIGNPISKVHVGAVLLGGQRDGEAVRTSSLWTCRTTSVIGGNIRRV